MWQKQAASSCASAYPLLGVLSATMNGDMVVDAADIEHCYFVDSA
jgi:hypothetical protein